MPTVKLTDKIISSLEPPTGREPIVTWDTTVRGFSLRVYPSGDRVFWVQFRNVHGRTRKLKLGRYGVLTLAGARKHAREILAAVALGEDPAEAKREARRAPTFSDLAQRYLVEYAVPGKKARSVSEDRRNLEKTLLPAFGSMRLDEITRETVRQWFSRMPKKVAANRARALLSTMFRLAEQDYRLVPEGTPNPCAGIKRHKEKPRTRTLSDGEIARLGEVLIELEKTKPSRRHPCDVLRLLLLTGCRRGELENLRWSEVRAEAGVLELADSKTGPKTVNVSAAAMALLTAQPRVAEHVFPTLVGRPQVLAGLWRSVRLAAPELADARIHDLRHAYASAAVRAGVAVPLLRDLLGHSDLAMTSRYIARLDRDPLRDAAERIGSRVAAALAGNAPAEVHRIGA